MTIIAAVDRSDRASEVVAQAAELSTFVDEPVHVVHALTRSEFVNLGATSAQAEKPLDMDEVRDAAAEMAEESVPDINVPYETVGIVGDPADEIVEYAANVDARYIVVRPRRRSPAGKALFGSVAQSILLNASCPVVTIP
ncbi:universal stress protein UspA (plasmid) [Halostagnicola larsenii XH-48]|uniref:Universal stress protein UspA n=1 Tax=Halostagnicola larsenii XH-48 TaxID=797299 RepID=W0JWU0_9EURY|nr:universal stress protein [Halostagnicola larsenii]AHG01700.1 universal stress protein UspA [Halostagnicola larsenii XH-48]